MKSTFTALCSYRPKSEMITVVSGVLFALVGLSACTPQDVPVDNTAMLRESDRVSTVPWNKPQGWEQTGALGQLTNDPHFQATH